MGWDSGKYILVYRLGGIGDAVVALPAIRLIRENYPDCRLVLFNLSVVDNLAQAGLYGEPGLFAEKHFALPPHNLWQKLALYGKFLHVGLRHRYAALYCFAPARPRVLDWLFRILHRARARLCLLPERDNRLPIHGEYLEFLRREGMRPGADCNAFPVSGENREKAAALLREVAPGRETPLVAFGIGGAEQACRWPLDKYSELLAKLRREFAFIPVYLGGENDRENAQKLIKGHGGFFCTTPRAGTRPPLSLFWAVAAVISAMTPAAPTWRRRRASPVPSFIPPITSPRKSGTRSGGTTFISAVTPGARAVKSAYAPAATPPRALALLPWARFSRKCGTRGWRGGCRRLSNLPAGGLCRNPRMADKR